MKHYAILLGLLAGMAGETPAHAAWSETDGPSFNPAPPPASVVRGTNRGLCTMRAPMKVFAQPRRSSRVLDTYRPGAIMTYVGDVGRTPYAYVSPCNACNPGYVLKAEFLRHAHCTR